MKNRVIFFSHKAGALNDLPLFRFLLQAFLPGSKKEMQLRDNLTQRFVGVYKYIHNLSFKTICVLLI